MKTIKIAVLALSSLCFSPSFCEDDFKIAFYNLKKCAEYHPLSVEGYNDLKVKTDGLNKELREISSKIDHLEDLLEKGNDLEIRKKKTDLETSFIEKKDSLDLLKKMEPRRIMQMMEFSINNILKKIAKEKGYKVILPIQQYSYIEPDIDITELVIQRTKDIVITNWKENLLEEIKEEYSNKK